MALNPVKMRLKMVELRGTKPLVKLLLMLLFCVFTGAGAGWGYRHASGARFGKIRPTTHRPRLSLEDIVRRKDEIITGAVAGGLFGLVIILLTIRDGAGRSRDND